MKRQFFQNLPGWLRSHVFYRANLTNTYDDEKDPVEVHPLDANLISSKKINGAHALLLDLDSRSYVVDSTTSGHKHLYIDADLDLEALKEIVDVLAKHGIVEEGIQNQLARRGFLSLRPPGDKKGTDDDLDTENYKKKIEYKPVSPKSETFEQAINSLNLYHKKDFPPKLDVTVKQYAEPVQQYMYESYSDVTSPYWGPQYEVKSVIEIEGNVEYFSQFEEYIYPFKMSKVTEIHPYKFQAQFKEGDYSPIEWKTLYGRLKNYNFYY